MRERRFVVALAAFAALRVLFSAAAFPFLNNVDETAHCDLVLKYARGAVPGGLEHYSLELAEVAAPYVSNEFGVGAESYGAQPAGPRAGAALDAQLRATIRWARTFLNKESEEPPLYYALAGLWLRLGAALGVTGIGALYWVRALDAPVAAALVWLGHVTARAVFADSTVERLGVPLLLAVFPQDTFYAIAPDMLSPLLFGLGFLGLLRLWTPESLGPPAAVGTGLALAGAVLAKLVNLPLVGVACAAALWRARESARERGARAALPGALLLACAVLPIAALLVWNHARFADWTGTAAKVRELGWTRKSLSTWWPHPLFTPAGLWTFWSGLLATFWRGEFTWHGAPLAHRAMDLFYAISSAILPGLALLHLPSRVEARRALVLGAACFASAVVLLAVLSLSFDFIGSLYPSRSHPFFTSGRLATGALVPFLLLYVRGLDRALSFAGGGWLRWTALALIAGAITLSELWLDAGPLASPVNILHAAS